MSLENICMWKKASSTQREEEMEIGLGEESTFGFENIGCYDCEGFKTICPSYVKRSVAKEYFMKANEFKKFQRDNAFKQPLDYYSKGE